MVGGGRSSSRSLSFVFPDPRLLLRLTGWRLGCSLASLAESLRRERCLHRVQRDPGEVVGCVPPPPHRPPAWYADRARLTADAQTRPRLVQVPQDLFRFIIHPSQKNKFRKITRLILFNFTIPLVEHAPQKNYFLPPPTKPSFLFPPLLFPPLSCFFFLVCHTTYKIMFFAIKCFPPFFDDLFT